ncbi:MAG: hypothetical protein GKR87_00900 [Kiritimatiellae bacterium]|nr:hypothetical protein [Kiritimatiellia bacterium]
MKNAWLIFLGLLTLGVGLLLNGANLYFGDLNQDEGWYLYAGKQVSNGKIPYRDFAFTQAPVMPFVYSLIHPLVKREGIAGGRLFTTALGLIAGILSAWLAARVAPVGWGKHAALIAFTLITCNVYQSYFMTVVKTYALCSLFLVSGLLAASFTKNRYGWVAAAGAAALLALAAGTRISTGIALPVIGLYFLSQRKHLGDPIWISFGVGGMLSLFLIFFPLAWMAFDGLWFGLFEYHSLRMSGNWLSQGVYKAGFISRFVQAYFVFVCFGAALIMLYILKPIASGITPLKTLTPNGFSKSLLGVGIAVSFVHFCAPFPYDDYQTIIYPVLSIVLALGLVQWIVTREQNKTGTEISMPNIIHSKMWMMWLLTLLFFTSVFASFSSPINQQWMVLGQDRIWWRLKNKTDINKLREVSDSLSQKSFPNDLLLTQDTYLAVEADKSVPHGMEMGPFCYFPEWSRERAEKLNVLNKEMLLELFQTTQARYAAFSEYGLAIQSPEIREITQSEQAELKHVLHQYFELEDEQAHFGQAHTTLKIFKKK